MKFHFQASPAPNAQNAFKNLSGIYGHEEFCAKSDVIVALGGDGQALISLKDGIRYNKPVFGINYGDVGSLMNPPRTSRDLTSLPERIEAAETFKLYPLRYKAEFSDGTIIDGFAINEVVVCNHDRSKSVKLEYFIDEIKLKAPRDSGDGIIAASPVGSTAYNRNARGYVLPLNACAIALTPNNALKQTRRIVVANSIAVHVIRDPYHTGDVIVDDRTIGKDCMQVKFRLDTDNAYSLKFDPGTLSEKIKRAQFSSLKPI
jgi:NAD+ kinase